MTEPAANNMPRKRKGIVPYPDAVAYSLYEGELSELVFITQLMLNALSLVYDIPHVPVSGRYDRATMTAVETFQRLNRLPVTGEVDPVTWDLLADEYNKTVNYYY